MEQAFSRGELRTTGMACENAELGIRGDTVDLLDPTRSLGMDPGTRLLDPT